MRITKQRLYAMQDYVNKIVKKKHRVDVQQRYGYYGIDNYSGSVCHATGLTSREAYMYLQGILHTK